MKHTMIKSALLRTVAVLLLTLGTISASAQYYQMVVHTDDGLAYPFNVNRIDSVSFVLKNEEEKTIEFKLANSSHATGATISNNSDVANNGGFKVWGFKDTGSSWVTVLDGQTVSSSDDGNTWTYSPKKYWDMSASGYRFYAAAPAENANGTIDFSNNTVCVNNVHYTKVGNNETECKVHRGVVTTWDSLSGQVEFSLQHIMSRITIHFKKSDIFNSVDVELKEISLEGWNGGNGNYKLNVASSEVDASEWTIPVVSSGVVQVQEKNGLAIPDFYVTVVDYLMIPQIIDADALKLHIKYDHLYSDGNVDVYEYTLNLNEGAQMTWATGNCYDYFITFRHDQKPKVEIATSRWPDEIVTSFVPEYVDLGLSVKWATCNVGATKPEEYGDYYAWGETDPMTNNSWSTYKWCNGSSRTLTKYNTISDYGIVDNKTTLDQEDDVAHVKWGSSWRMPTMAEYDELRNNCTWTWTTVNGVNGYRVTSKKSGYTDRSIFLPAAGYRYGTNLSYVGSYGYFWSSSLNTDSPDGAWSLDFLSGNHETSGSSRRGSGQTVRPVCP